MISGGDDIRSGRKQLVGGICGDAIAVGGILAVDNGDVNAVFAFERGEFFRKEAASDAADHIADHE